LMFRTPLPWAMHHPKIPKVAKGMIRPLKVKKVLMRRGWTKHYFCLVVFIRGKRECAHKWKL
jgi:hypothetical protein